MNEEYTYEADSDMRQFGLRIWVWTGLRVRASRIRIRAFWFWFGALGLAGSDVWFYGGPFVGGLVGACRKRFIQSVLVRGYGYGYPYFY